MRTYFILFLLLAIGIPLAVKYGITHSGFEVAQGCSDGPCLIHNFTNEPLQDRVLPKNLENIQKTDAFQPELDNHPRDQMINMDGGQGNLQNNPANGQNCQFGMCLPGQQAPQGNNE